MNGVGTLQARVGNRFWAGTGNLVIAQGADAIQPYAAPEEAGIRVDGNGVWGRIEGGHNKIKPRFSTSDTDFNQNIFKMQAGIDGLLSEAESGTMIGGIFSNMFTARPRQARCMVMAKFLLTAMALGEH